VYLGATVRRSAHDGLVFTLSKYAPGLAQPWHVHANPTLYALVVGRQRDRSRKADFLHERLAVVFHPTTEPHAGLVGPDGMVGLNIEFEPGWLERHELAERDLGGYRPLDSVWSALAVLRILPIAFQSNLQAQVDIEMRLLEILDPLVKRAVGRAPLGCPLWLRRARELLHDAYRSPLRVRWIANEVRVHPVHLTRVFRRHHGCTVSEYLRALRLAEAGRLILRQGHTIAEAAHEAGFADQAHLCRCFSGHFGFSPKTLRSTTQTFST
jgi:AraC-like DNA-binding protein